MKNLLKIGICFVVGAMLSATTLHAQTNSNAGGKATGYMLSAATHGIVDTASNAVAKVQTLKIAGYQASLVIQTLFAKISGTVGGTATLQGSIDGTVWTTVGSPFTLTDVASQNVTFDVGLAKYVNYRLTVAGTGTMAVKFQSPWLTRSPN